ncbi:MAG: phosphotransferase [Puniceicoccales bacterium]|jgi:aminoglycoside/choline kinase family phosphotransferase|nr:phosphotransferase [Puniceicoccales bacterium]
MKTCSESLRKLGPQFEDVATREGPAWWESPGDPLPKGGSGRVFCRVKSGGLGSEPTAICCRHDGSREENALYAPLAVFLREVGFPVPRVLAREDARRALLLQDLGSRDLLSLAASPWPERRAAYFSALDALFFLHSGGLARLQSLPPGERPRLMPGFDEALYHWEQDYFRRHCLLRLARGPVHAARLCEEPAAWWEEFAALPPMPAGEGVSRLRRPESAFSQELAALIARLLGHPRALVHRDCQSENILWHDGRAWFIDFQGMREGSPWYDVASLLQDPYAGLDGAQRRELFDYYAAKLDAEGRACAQRRYLDASAQRLMQALGAYGFLGVEKKRTAFLRHSRPALQSLCRVTSESPLFPNLNRAATALLCISDPVSEATDPSKPGEGCLGA